MQHTNKQPGGKNTLECRAKIGHYSVRKKLAEGSFGIVYEAEAEFSNKTFAIKELFIEELCKRADNGMTVEADEHKRGEFESYKDDFVREAEELQSLNHKNIVVEHDLIRDLNGTSYLVMENLRGGTLEDRICKQPSGIPYLNLKPVILGVLDALIEIHRKSVLHRDVKPLNIGFRELTSWEPVLMDFGISCPSMQPHCVSGTPPYSPLDQDSDTDEDHREYNDIYAFGATLFRCMTGATPPTAKQRHIDRSKGKPDVVKESLFSHANKGQGYPKHVRHAVYQMMSLSGNKRGSAEKIKKVIEKKYDIKKHALFICVFTFLFIFIYFALSEDTVTSKNYTLISVGMDKEEVLEVLGNPVECVNKFSREVCNWGGDDKFIEVTFVGSRAALFDSKGLD